MCFVWISEQTATFALQNIKRLVFVTEVESVYSAVGAESLHKTDMLRNGHYFHNSGNLLICVIHAVFPVR
jgi:hypothetical protein